MGRSISLLIFFFNLSASPVINTLSLHDALPISLLPQVRRRGDASRPAGQTRRRRCASQTGRRANARLDRKSTRLNSSHVEISYAVFCLKKKNSDVTRAHVST